MPRLASVALLAAAAALSTFSLSSFAQSRKAVGVVEMATADKFQRVFLNPRDIGGRYAALSYFGMVPGALIGADIRRLLERANGMRQRCAANVSARENPGASLGVTGRMSATQIEQKERLDRANQMQPGPCPDDLSWCRENV